MEWTLQEKFEHLSEADLASGSYLQEILAILDIKPENVRTARNAALCVPLSTREADALTSAWLNTRLDESSVPDGLSALADP